MPLSVSSVWNVSATALRTGADMQAATTASGLTAESDSALMSRTASGAHHPENNDQRAVTIECASDLTEPYAMKPEVYSALVELCTDICRRNGKRKLVWISDRDKALAYSVKSDEMLLTVHRWFAKKSCPGNWLMERLGSLADEVNGKLAE